MNRVSAAELLALMAALAALVGGLWKAFEAIAKLRERINENLYQIKLLQQQVEASDDKLQLGLKGVEEVAHHVRSRTQNDYQMVNTRLLAVERFLEKTTGFQARE